jgi:hypothetical protein
MALCKEPYNNGVTFEFEPRLAGSAPTCGCDPFARNRPSGRGMGGKGRLTFGIGLSR